MPTNRVTVVTGAEQEAADWTPLHGDNDIGNKILWRSPAGDTIVGLIRMQPGSTLGGHMHPTATQHTWVIEGQISIAGTPAPGGSYAYAPPGADQETAAVGTEPSTLFYIYHPYELTHDHPDD